METNDSGLVQVVKRRQLENGEVFPVYLARQNSATRSSRRSLRGGSKRLVRRLIKKSGKSNIFRSRIPTLWDRYIRDLANTLVDSSWRWTMIALTSSFILSWLLFACIWMLISNANGDFDLVKPSERPCLAGIQGFGGFMMFSIETQQTIGYGSRYISHHCPEGTFMMCMQIILGCALCGAMVSIVNAKMVRPLQSHSRNLFSKRAVIGIRDGCMCLIFRLRDENGRYGVGTAIDAYLVQSRPGEPFLKSLHLEPFGTLIWPLEVVHKISCSSPFWDLSAKELITKRFEIIVRMRGTSAVTGQSSETRTSYLSTEILWGSRFKPCVHFKPELESYFVEHSLFNATEEVLTPLCSAQRLGEVIEDITTPDDLVERVFAYGQEDLIVDTSGDGSSSSEYDNLDEGRNNQVLPIEVYEYVDEIRRRKNNSLLNLQELLDSLEVESNAAGSSHETNL